MRREAEVWWGLAKNHLNSMGWLGAWTEKKESASSSPAVVCLLPDCDSSCLIHFRCHDSFTHHGGLESEPEDGCPFSFQLPLSGYFITAARNIVKTYNSLIAGLLCTAGRARLRKRQQRLRAGLLLLFCWLPGKRLTSSCSLFSFLLSQLEGSAELLR